MVVLIVFFDCMQTEETHTHTHREREQITLVLCVHHKQAVKSDALCTLVAINNQSCALLTGTKSNFTGLVQLTAYGN